MLEILGKAIIEFLERELVEAAPEIEKILLEQAGSLAQMLYEYLMGKSESVASFKMPELPKSE